MQPARDAPAPSSSLGALGLGFGFGRAGGHGGARARTAQTAFVPTPSLRGAIQAPTVRSVAQRRVAGEGLACAVTQSRRGRRTAHPMRPNASSTTSRLWVFDALLSLTSKDGSCG